MIGFIIDPVTQTITKTHVGEKIEDIYEAIGARPFTVLHLGPGEVIYLDDEALLRDPTPVFYFYWGDYPQPLAGKGLILGINDDSGDSCSSNLDLDFVVANVRFAELEFLGFDPIPRGTMVERFGKMVPVFGQVPKFREKSGNPDLNVKFDEDDRAGH